MTKYNVGDTCWFTGHPVGFKPSPIAIEFINEGQIILKDELSVTILTDSNEEFIALHENLYESSQEALDNLFKEKKEH
jgi:hypothetical protein